MSALTLIILLLLAQLLLSSVLLSVAIRLSRQSRGQSISTYESDHALDTEDLDTQRLPTIDHHTAWINQPTFHTLPAWPPLYEGPTIKHPTIS